MNRVLAAVSLIGLICTPSPASLPDIQEGALPALDIRLDYRSLQPGEVLRITLSGKADIQWAHFRFSGEKHPLWQSAAGGDHIAFLGLDLELAPGSYPLSVTAQLEDGTLSTLTKEIEVKSRDFPVERLRVDPKYVTPPAEALERIRLEAQLMRSVYSGFSPEWLGEGSFVLPTAGRVSPNFGRRRIFNDQPRSPHSGVDISSPQGTPVLASNSGRVVLTRGLYYAGNTVIIDHGLGVFSVYLHLSRMLVEEGSLVIKGDTIGEVGATGRVTGPHLHWSVRIRNSRVDPLSLLDLRLD
jgi:murein DD-endopeptidase MepM/ murein hydrolase activator NlpD